MFYRMYGVTGFESYIVLSNHIMSYHILNSYPILSYPLLSYPLISYPILSDLILFYLILSSPISFLPGTESFWEIHDVRNAYEKQPTLLTHAPVKEIVHHLLVGGY